MVSSTSGETSGERAHTILVVEDNPVERTLITRILKVAQLDVIDVDCGRAALEQAVAIEPDLILLDALLPDIDGFNVCAQLQRNERARFIPVVMLTGLDDVASIDRAYDAGATDFITKPVNHALLVHRIRYLLRARSMFEELRRSRDEILRLAYFDRLTALPNRSLLELMLDQEIPRAHRAGHGVALICIDLDLFSRVNNAMGHAAGDAVLRQVAMRLARLIDAPSAQVLLERLPLTTDVSGVQDGGLAARLGADTFALMISGAAVKQRVRELTQLVRQSFQQAFLYRGQEVFITASLGFSCSDGASCAAEVLLQQADMALREAKLEARSEAREYHGEMVTQVSAQMLMQSDMRKALRRAEFLVHYQPKVAVRSGAVTGFEALIRWRHPARDVSPTDFIQVAEEAGQILEIGRWVLQTACYQFRQWLERGLVSGRIAVNISARQFREPDVAQRVLAALEQSGLAPRYLELEITEGVLMSDPRAHAVIEELRRHGISIALDDFGTGYSSLSYLTRFPIDTLKIDRCFVSDIAYESEQAAIVTAVASLSHRLNMKVIAEGVESESELQIVTDLGCDEVQGFLLCKPLSAADMERWLQHHASERQAGSAT